ncbi:MAG: Extradiol ring-cleavage dioxygenase, class III enzyme, subunit B [Parcubacteria group bacterium GW2011_GWA2_56_7]|nr:MAG: Extradiol ring-cleavage dioxygenase, class III enzyme, subunit B [Parcubacteria group bacterium GW2011_GWA2_56_7]
MLIYGAFLPHSPLLIPSVHPENRDTLAETENAIRQVSEYLYSLRPDVLCVISGHGERYQDSFSMEVAPAYETDLKTFGDLSHAHSFRPATTLIDKLQRHLRKKAIPFTLSTRPILDYGVSVALRLTAEHLKEVRLLPIAYADVSRKEHFTFGQALRDVLEETPLRVAVLAVGDLSHCLTSGSPGGFCKEGAVFDAAVQEALRGEGASALLSLPETLVEKAKESGYRPLVILKGLFDRLIYRTEILSYEAPMDVGYLVAQFLL